MNFSFILRTELHSGEGMFQKVGEIVRKLGEHCLVVIGKASVKKSGALEKLLISLKNIGIKSEVFEGIEENPSIETVQRGGEVLKEIRAKCANREGNKAFIIALGGGSVIDASKGIAIASSTDENLENYFGEEKVNFEIPPIVAIPTTSGTGSEVTRYAVITDLISLQKKVITSQKIYPRIAILDPLLCLSMPLEVTTNTGLDALSHAIEGYFSKKAHPFSDLLATQSIELISQNLLKVCKNGKDIVARGNMHYASYLAGIVISTASTGIIHAMGYSLTTKWGMPHGFANAILMPEVIKYYQNCCILPEDEWDKKIKTKLKKFNELLTKNLNLKGKDASKTLSHLIEKLNVYKNISKYDFNKADLPSFVEGVMANERLLSVATYRPNKEEVEEIYKKVFKDFIT